MDSIMESSRYNTTEATEHSGGSCTCISRECLSGGGIETVSGSEQEQQLNNSGQRSPAESYSNSAISPRCDLGLPRSRSRFGIATAGSSSTTRPSGSIINPRVGGAISSYLQQDVNSHFELGKATEASSLISSSSCGEMGEGISSCVRAKESYKSYRSRRVFQNYGHFLTVLVCVLTLTLLQSHVTLGFNVDLETAVIHKGPKDSYFGYAVAQHIDQSTSWALVGAPLAHTTAMAGVNNSGAVYRCKSSGRNVCQEMRFDTTGNAEAYNPRERRMNQIEEKSNQWLGATVQSSGENGVVVVCAPRYIYFSRSFNKREPIGMCFVEKAKSQGAEVYSPCKNENYGFHRQGFCQAGLSAALSQDGQRLLIGAPGSWYWQGQVINYNTENRAILNSTAEGTADEDDSYRGYASAVGDFDGDNIDDYVVGVPKGERYLGKVDIYTQDLENTTSIVGDQIGAYFGSALAVIDLNSDRRDDIVVGAPFFADFVDENSYDVGRVYIFYQSKSHKFKKKDILEGTQSMARFGSALSKLGDINYDGHDDLCVSAPYGGEERKGVIYIYHGSTLGIITQPSQVIHAQELNPALQAFGISLSSGLDQDGNSYPDILVGAHESDRAVVLRTRPVVRVFTTLTLTPQNISLEERRCNHLGREPVPCLEVYTCIIYEGKEVPQELSFDLTWVLDAKDNSSNSKEQRAFYSNSLNTFTETRTEKLKKNNSSCFESRAYVKNDPGDKLSPIKATLTFKLSEISLNRQGRRLPPVLDAYISTTTSFTAQIVKDCGHDNICIPDLEVNTIRVTPVHTIGLTADLDIFVIVNNHGEDAFNARLYITLPSGIKRQVRTVRGRNSMPVTCTALDTKERLVVCNLGNPMKSKTEIQFTLKVEPTNSNDTKENLVFTLYANSTNNENPQNYENNYHSIAIPVTVEPDVDLRGKVHPDFLRVKTSELDTVDKEPSRAVKHVYQVQNQGSSAINETELQIRWPSYDHDGESVLEIVDKLDISGNGKCKIININPDNVDKYRDRGWNEDNIYFYLPDSKTKRAAGSTKVECTENYCTIIQCLIGYMDPMDTFVITINSTFNAYKFMKAREVTKKYFITAVANVRVRSVPYDFESMDDRDFEVKTVQLSTEITTEQHRPAGKGVEMWMIAVAILAGLLFLLLLILLFWWCGFFKRKKPVEEGYFVVNGKTDIDNKIFE